MCANYFCSQMFVSCNTDTWFLSWYTLFALGLTVLVTWLSPLWINAPEKIQTHTQKKKMSEKKKKKKKRTDHRTCPIFSIHHCQIKKFAGKLFYNNHSVMAFPVLWVSVLIFLCYTNQTQTTGFSNNKKTTNIHVGILCMYNSIKKSSLSLTLSP